jgi:hypothetical protein
MTNEISGKGFTHESPHQGATNTWLTPKYVIDALGPFDLDPCAAPEPRPWPTATNHITLPDDGLAHNWASGAFVWLNPPYGPNTGTWLAKLARHQRGIALTYARTETRAFFDSVFPHYSGILFIKGRMKFCKPDGTSGESAAAPSVLIGYGEEALKRLSNTRIEGHLVVSSAAIILNSDGKDCQTWREAVQQASQGKTMKLKTVRDSSHAELLRM